MYKGWSNSSAFFKVETSEAHIAEALAVLLTSLLEATARWRGVSHMLSLALTRAPAKSNGHLLNTTSPKSEIW